MTRKNLLDTNVLIALADQRHDHHQIARGWFASSGKDNWAICPLTESGFLRVTTNPAFRPGPRTLEHAVTILQALKGLPGYSYWKIDETWITLTAPFAARISGHQQVTDAYLLGLAIREDSVLVTFDKGVVYLAGVAYSQHVLLLK
ncbi:MAG: TA system VapC family ribonuclease toxin [Terracidiphilus sp.]